MRIAKHALSCEDSRHLFGAEGIVLDIKRRMNRPDAILLAQKRRKPLFSQRRLSPDSLTDLRNNQPDDKRGN